MQISESKVPAYDVVKEKIRQVDTTIIIAKVFYMSDTTTYRFQLVKREKMCMVELPKKLLDAIDNKSPLQEQQLVNIVVAYLKASDCWSELTT